MDEWEKMDAEDREQKKKKSKSNQKEDLWNHWQPIISRKHCLLSSFSQKIVFHFLYEKKIYELQLSIRKTCIRKS